MPNNTPFGAASGTPPAEMPDFAALPVEVIAPDLELTAHGSTVLPLGVLQSDGVSWKPVGRVVLSPAERERLLFKLAEHVGQSDDRLEVLSPAEVIALTGHDMPEIPEPIKVPGPVRTLAVEVARLGAHIEELNASCDKIARQVADDIIKRAELSGIVKDTATAVSRVEDRLRTLEQARLPAKLEQLENQVVRATAVAESR